MSGEGPFPPARAKLEPDDGDSQDEIGAKDGQNHGRELPLPVRVLVVLHGKQERRESGPERAERDQELGGHARGQYGDDELRAGPVEGSTSASRRREERGLDFGALTLRKKPVMLQGR